MRACFIAAIGLAAFSTFAAAPENLIPNPGFETWADKENRPVANTWQWNFGDGGQREKAFEFFGRSNTEKHSGEWSLRLKDTNRGSLNNSFDFMVAANQMSRFAGKTVTFSAWVKQTGAARAGIVGIGFWAKGKNGKSYAVSRCIDSAGETGWTFLKVKLALPEDVELIFARLLCADGWGGAGEAYFDDLSFTIGDPDPEQTSAPAPSPAGERKTPETTTHLSFLAPVPPSWEIKSWGGFERYNGKNAELEFRFPAQAAKWSGFHIATAALNRVYNLPADLLLRARANRNPPLQFRLDFHGFNAAIVLTPEKQADGSWLYEAPLDAFHLTRPATALSGLSVQTPEPLDGKPLVFSELALCTRQPAAPAVPAVSSEVEAFRSSYEKAETFERDDFRRPTVRNGTWYDGDRPVFYYGPWLYGRWNSNNDWSASSNPLKIDHIAHTTPPCREVLDAMGFNSAQISAAPALPGAALFGAPVTDPAEHEKNIATFYGGFRGEPLVVDFAFGFWASLAADNPKLKAELEQRFGDWHEFIPACPEHPEGDRYYRSFFQGGVLSILRKGGNPFVWELFNESSYNCECRYNARAFADAMKQRYGTIEAANRQWKTVFDSFDDLAQATGFKQYPRLWPDWCKFSGRRYAEILKKYGKFIRSIDRRPNVYLSEQTSNMKLYKGTGAGMDYRLIAETLDSLGIEGGWRYGNGGFASTDIMEAAAAAENVTYPFICDLFQALSRGVKPVMNHEHYCGRFEFGKRVPSRREDIVTSMWGEIMHGVSGSYHYSWDKRAFDWKTFDEAKANVINGGYKAYSTLNPYNWPVGELDGFKQFTEELEPYRDKLLPFPRFREPSVAVFYSYPTLRMLPISREDFERKMFNWYAALLYGNYPLRFVFEEELKKGLPAEIDALVVPCASYLEDGTLEAIRKFAANGRPVIADNGAFRFDEYGSPIDAAGLPCSRLNAADPASIGELRAILAKAKVRRDAVLDPLDGRKNFAAAETHLIDRGDFKFIFLVNWNDPLPVPARLKLNIDDPGEFHLIDPVSRRELLPETGNAWNKAALAAGVELYLPSQERVLLTLERSPRPGVEAIRPAEMRKRYEQALKREKRKLSGQAAQKAENDRRNLEARRFEHVATERCTPLNLAAAVNMGFRDEIADDGKGGWFDQGENDFAAMPLGKIKAAEVPFTVIDPAANAGRAAIMLRGTMRPGFPVEVRNIPVNAAAKQLYFLHTCGWDAKPGERVFSYFVRYGDGTEEEIPIRYGREIGGWWGGRAEQAKIAVESSNALHTPVQLYCFRWRNSHPDKTIRTLDAISANGAGVPAIVAVTLEK